MRILIPALLALALAACGFHLRGQDGSGVLRLTRMHIDAQATPAVERQLTAGYQRLGGEPGMDAPLTLRITNEIVNSQTSVIDPTVQVAERTVFYELDFQLRHASGVPAQPERRIRLRRGFQFDNTRIVGKFEEENQIIEDLRQQAVAQVLMQISRIGPDDLAPDAAPTPAAGAGNAPVAKP